MSGHAVHDERRVMCRRSCTRVVIEREHYDVRRRRWHAREWVPVSGDPTDLDHVQFANALGKINA